jgi:LssY C-terminus
MEDVARRLLVIVAALLLSYLVVPYLIMPAVWKCYARRHSSFDDVPGVTHTASGVPGGPLNVALVGSEAEIKALMASAKLYGADSLSLRSDLEIAADTALDRPYDDAPVSNLYLWVVDLV